MSESMRDKKGSAKLDSLTEQLLDLTKNNRLLNFRAFRASTIEVLAPDYEEIFNHLDGVKEKLDVFSQTLTRNRFIRSRLDDDDEESVVVDEDSYRQAYLKFALDNKKDDEIVLFSPQGTLLTLIKKVAKNANEILGETGVNVVYLAAGFVSWTESEESNQYFRAPILLIPVQIKHGTGNEYSIVRHDDEAVFNPTFRYKLEHDFGLSVDEFVEGRMSPKDFIEDLKALLAKSKPTWQVSDACWIGLFTFQKMNMYSDLKNNKSKILSNPLILRLFGLESEGEASFGGSGSALENPLIELKTVTDADSSQMQAIEAAKSGESFVLQGPPGTGKSQTITNIIAECLSDGKKVLFVSEKMAALNVVYTNLRNAGLEDYCLELHSNKANKRAVISKICDSILDVRRAPESVPGNELRRNYQQKLDAYDEAIHRKLKPLDMSLYQLYGAVLGLRDIPDVNWTASASSSWSAEKFQAIIRAIGTYSKCLESLGCEYWEHAWFGFSKIDLKFADRSKLKDELEIAGRFFLRFNALAKEISETYKIHCLTPDEGRKWEQFFRLAASDHPVIAPGCLQPERFDRIFKLWDTLKEHGIRTLAARKNICDEYLPEVLQLDGAVIYRRLRDDFDNVLLRWFKREFWALLKDFRKCRIERKFLKYDDACDIAKRLRFFQLELSEFESIEKPVKASLGEAYEGIFTDWDTVREQVDSLRKLFEANLNFDSFGCYDAQQFADCQGKFLSYADRLAQCFDEQSTEALTYLGNVFNVSEFDVWHTDGTKVADKFETCEHAIELLDRWCAFALARQALGDRDVEVFVDIAHRDGIPPTRIADVFRKAVYSYQINLNVYDNPVLKYFDAATHESVVRQFCELDKVSSGENRSVIRNNLNKFRPTRNEIMRQSQRTPLKVLLHESQKRSKVMSIRKVMHEAGTDILTLKPCFLMSPLSVSTYLDENFDFDVVIFDEASQIFPQDAIGSIYRGRQLIVVGDSKQMPPSNFFRVMEHTSDDDEEPEDEIELAAAEDKGYESILDWCTASFAAYSLLWHYRSRSEALIAFSNLRFYDGRLMTFPTPQMNAESFGITYKYVEGRFENQVNKIEAEEVVRQVIDCLQRYPERSLGVIVFSLKQEDRVESLLEKKLKDYPELRKLLSEDRAEPFFVKNLETVQGYERDTIIFSVAYGPNASGVISHNFGPLNRKGGERRLNVAVTRARCNIRVIASMHGADIDLKRTKAEGAKNLKLYLDYAERGASALDNPLEVPHEDMYDSAFEKDVCEFLRMNRISVDTQVGCAGYRIDLAVKLPHSSDYVLAIECDGATYHSAKNARDRDRLRQEVLESKGWVFKRIWSTDWYKHREETARALLETVRQALRAAEIRIESTSSSETEPSTANFDNQGLKDDGLTPDVPTQPPVTKSPEATDTGASEESPIKEELKPEAPTDACLPEETPLPFATPAPNDFWGYSVAAIEDLALKHNPQNDFAAFVSAIVKVEAPLSVDWLEHRVVGYFDRRVVTDVFDRDFKAQLNRCREYGVIRKGNFLWLANQTEKDVIFRKNTSTVKRKIEDISPEELAAGLQAFSQRMEIKDKNLLFRKFAAEGLLLSRVYDKTEKYLDDAYRLIDK